MKQLGTVVIARNEGARLQACLRSTLAVSPRVVYVDSGSTDGSPEWAAAQGADVVALDTQRGFTAARARNAGLARLLAQPEPPEFVQFVDGDCELVPGWAAAAVAFMQQHPDVAMVCGRRRERFPEASVYNQLCDLEWNTPVGRTLACGGDAVARVAAVEAVGAYRDTLIAGEEPELCVRLRAAGWQIHRLGLDMTWHDAAMHRFGQWWRRSQRAGHAFAEGYALHGAPPERHWQREVRRPWLWAAALPLLTLAACLAFGAWGLLLLLAYPLQIARQAGRTAPEAPLRWRAPALQMLGKFAELQGQLLYLRNRVLGRSGRLIEYK